MNAQLQFKIQIEGIKKPPVWRRVLVPDRFSFKKLHEVIQAAFGWHGHHLYAFCPNGLGSHPEIGIPDTSDFMDDEIIDSKKKKLHSIFKYKGQNFQYVYDFGDHWVHRMTLEAILPGKVPKAMLVNGRGACPPEDCGGIYGYEHMLKVLADPMHEEYKNMREWLDLSEDEKWDPEYFDQEASEWAVYTV